MDGYPQMDQRFLLPSVRLPIILPHIDLTVQAIHMIPRKLLNTHTRGRDRDITVVVLVAAAIILHPNLEDIRIPSLQATRTNHLITASILALGILALLIRVATEEVPTLYLLRLAVKCLDRATWAFRTASLVVLSAIQS